jgi:hypothetical protein
MTRTRKRLLYCLLAIAAVAGCVYVYYAIRNAYYQSQLNEVIAALDAREPGWRWEDRFAKLPKVEKEQSLAEELRKLMRLLAIDDQRNLLGRTAWGNEFDRIEVSPFFETERNYYLNHPNAILDSDFINTYSALHQMEPGPEALQRLLKLNNKQVALFEHKYSEMLYFTLLRDVQATRSLVTFLRWKAALLLEANDAEEAARHISAMLMISRVYDNDPFWVCQLIRAAELQMTTHATQRLLAQSTTTSPATLKRLQEEFTTYEKYITSIDELLRWDRAFLDHDLAEIEKFGVGNHFFNIAKKYRIANKVYTNIQWIDDTILRINPLFMLETWERPRHLAIERKETLEYFDRVLQWAHSPEHELLSRYQAMKTERPGLPPFVYALLNVAGNAYSLKDYRDRSYNQVERIAKTHLTMRAQCRAIATALAAERFRLDRQRWPTSLQEMVPKYLATVPLDPFTGKPLLMMQQADGITIYSVGTNGIDQQGTVFPVDKQYENDIGYRLWNPDKRRADHSKEIKKALEDSSK